MKKVCGYNHSMSQNTIIRIYVCMREREKKTFNRMQGSNSIDDSNFH